MSDPTNWLLLVVGALLGGALAVNVNATMLSGIFAVIALIVGVNMLNPKPLSRLRT